MLKISHSIKNFNTGPSQVKQTEPYVIFTIDNEEFGVEARKVLELVNYMTPLKMPNNYANVEGMASYRGKIIPIVDLRMIFGLEPLNYGETAVTIVVESGCIFGITAEQVLDLDFIPLTSIKKVSAFNFGEKTKYLKSVANFGERLVLLLDPAKMVETQKAQPILEDREPGAGLLKVEASNGCYETKLDNPSLPGKLYPKELIETSQLNRGPEYLIDPQELEDLLNGISKPGQEEETPSTNELELTPNLDALDQANDNDENGILEPERITEILSGLESDLAAELPNDLFQMKIDAKISTEAQPTDGCLSDGLIENIIKELEAESQLISKETLSGKGLLDLKADQIEAAGEKSDV